MIPYSKPYFSGKEKEYLNQALDSGWISGGEFITRFEKGLEEIFEMKARVVSNGTAAIHLAYLAAGLKPGDKILGPGWGFLAWANVAIHCGLEPVFADVSKDTWCLSVGNVIENQRGIKAIIPIHTYGNMSNMFDIKNAVDVYCAKNKENIVIIEDCAESLFSKCYSRYAGTFSDISTFSLHATKTMTTGEGGFVLSENLEILRLAELYRSHGLPVRGKYYHEVPGHNFRMTNLQAAIGLAQLENLEFIIKERNRVYETYKNLLKDAEGITLQKIQYGIQPVIWAVGVSVDDKRDLIVEKMKESGIETRPGFISSSLLPIYKKHSLPVSEMLTETVLSLPSFPELTDKEIKYICNTLKGVIHGRC